ncbi:hypothetical protein GCM10010358_32010 [Streptomyces minutiscleroticus]|uniref:Uncharacterized protein n=1 Tax=Streptomyces minutiscleroticus TaxID=68238 RepID=A0A918KT88_9ACTN|nr:hypothetical protein GCM10010358_32010 [Streptomyces minutiscleroticus]
MYGLSKEKKKETGMRAEAETEAEAAGSRRITRGRGTVEGDSARISAEGRVRWCRDRKGMPWAHGVRCGASQSGGPRSYGRIRVAPAMRRGGPPARRARGSAVPGVVHR